MTPPLAPEGFDWESLPAPRRFEMTRTVQPAELDDLGHVNNTVYLVWCEAVTREHALSLGLGTPALAELGAVPVAREHLIRYARPALEGDQVRVRTAITASAGVRSTRMYTVTRHNPGDPPEGVLLAECRTEWVWVDPASGRPRRVPDEVSRRFGFSTV